MQTKGTAEDNAPLRLFLCGTQFQIKVWEALLTMPVGTLTTYGDLAQRVGYPIGAARAVGAANGANAISYLIPCHRVIRQIRFDRGISLGPRPEIGADRLGGGASRTARCGVEKFRQNAAGR